MSWQELVRTQIKGNTDKLAGVQKLLSATAVWDPPATGAVVGASVSTTVSVPGAVVGDVAHAGFSVALPANGILQASVTAADTVTVKLITLTAAAIDLASGTLKVVVTK